MLILYKNIRERRIELGMSQDELAKKAGYTNRSSVARIERGDTDLPLSKIMDIAKALRIDPAELMGWEEEIYAGESGEVMPVSELSPIEDELMSKVKMMRPDFQRMASSMLDSILEMQQNAERIGGIKEETNDD